MNHAVFIAVFLCFWITEGIILGYVASDSALSNIEADERNYTYSDFSGINISTDGINSQGSPSGFIGTMLKVFTFTLPSDSFPGGLSAVISAVNWMLAIVFGVIIYMLVRGI